MDEITALRFIDALSNGVHPATGEVLPQDSPLQQPDVIRALCLASRALGERRMRLSRQRLMPANVGKAWEEMEERALIEETRAGKTLNELAELHQRTPAGIQARLERMGLPIPPSGTAPVPERTAAAA